MNLKEFSLAVKKEYQNQNGERFFSERALLSALLEKAGFHRNAPLLSPDEEILPSLEEKMLSDLVKILSGYPIQYYVGTEFFCGEEFFVAENVLIPRPETELLVTLSCERTERESVVFDFCCGSGCIGLSLLKKREDLRAVLYDLSEDAISLTKKNREKLSLVHRAEVKKLDVLSSFAKEEILREKPSLILSNPPYLTKKEMEEIDDNVKREPSMALYGGEDGLLFYKALITLSEETKTPILCEIGSGQKEGVEVLLSKGEFQYEFFKDFSGYFRAFFASPKKRQK